MSLWQHIRHSRGYGIHSPFAYRLVREVMMKRRLAGTEHELYDELRAAGIKRLSAIRLQNYFSLFGCSAWAIDSTDRRTIHDGALLIFSPEKASAAVETADRTDAQRLTICILRPRKCPADRAAIIERHNGMSVENRAMLMLFYNELRPKQHITI